MRIWEDESACRMDRREVAIGRDAEDDGGGMRRGGEEEEVRSAELPGLAVPGFQNVVMKNARATGSRCE